LCNGPGQLPVLGYSFRDPNPSRESPAMRREKSLVPHPYVRLLSPKELPAEFFQKTPSLFIQGCFAKIAGIGDHSVPFSPYFFLSSSSTSKSRGPSLVIVAGADAHVVIPSRGPNRFDLRFPFTPSYSYWRQVTLFAAWRWPFFTRVGHARQAVSVEGSTSARSSEPADPGAQSSTPRLQSCPHQSSLRCSSSSFCLQG